MPETASVVLNGKSHNLPVIVGTENEHAVDVSKLRSATGFITLDDGYGNTGSCKSAITFIDGEKGILRYRGYPIEQLAENSTFLETAWLIIYGELPTTTQLDSWQDSVLQEEMLHEGLYKHFDGFPSVGHPMAILSAMINAASCYDPSIMQMESPETFQAGAARLISKIRTIAAASYKTSIGEPIVYPKPHFSYCANFLHMMFSVPYAEHFPDPDIVRALDVILLLHADHEQNCSTSTVRMVASSGANLFASCAAGVCALWGPLHGGANAAVIDMLQFIHDSRIDLKEYVARVKDKSSHARLMGFGHRVYKNYDPRAKIIKAAADKVLGKLKKQDPLLEIARRLEEVAAQRQLLQGSEPVPECRLLFRDHHAGDGHPAEHVHGHVRHRPPARLDRQLEGSPGGREPDLPPAAGLCRADAPRLRAGRAEVEGAGVGGARARGQRTQL